MPMPADLNGAALAWRWSWQALQRSGKHVTGMNSSRTESPVKQYLNRLYERLLPLRDGAVATYIPELAGADPDAFAICVATMDGYVYEVGDSRRPFTIQSMSKPFVYGLALEDRGKPAVLQRIGVEPTGDAFNEISLERNTGRPFNPMINAGAIASSSLVLGHSAQDRWDRILTMFSIYAGRKLELSESVYRSESATGHRNRGIGHLLRNFDILGVSVDEALDLYFRQCSIEVTARDLSVMAATLAAGGVNPITGERALSPGYVDELLSLMTTCGMYDYAGEWLYRVGLPAKSGVSGGVLAVLPGQLGIAVYSPLLDEHGNSVRGVFACEALSEDLELHFLRAPRAALATIRSRHTLRSIRSRRKRSDRQRAALGAAGEQAVVCELQGDLSFTGIEQLARQTFGKSGLARYLVVDLARVTGIDVAASRFLRDLLAGCRDRQQTILLVGLGQHPRLRRYLDEARLGAGSFTLFSFDELDSALEWCEARLLEAAGENHAGGEVALGDHELIRGLTASGIAALTDLLERREYAPRTMIVRAGDPVDAVFLIVRGDVSVLTESADVHLHRLSTLSTGMCFGESALIPHPDDHDFFVRADTQCVCWVLKKEAWVTIASRYPLIRDNLLQNVLGSAIRRLGHASSH
jgi:glutaminase